MADFHFNLDAVLSGESRFISQPGTDAGLARPTLPIGPLSGRRSLGSRWRFQLCGANSRQEDDQNKSYDFHPCFLDAFDKCHGAEKSCVGRSYRLCCVGIIERTCSAGLDMDLYCPTGLRPVKGQWLRHDRSHRIPWCKAPCPPSVWVGQGAKSNYYQPRVCSICASSSALTARPFIAPCRSSLTSSNTLGSW